MVMLINKVAGFTIALFSNIIINVLFLIRLKKSESSTIEVGIIESIANYVDIAIFELHEHLVILLKQSFCYFERIIHAFDFDDVLFNKCIH